MSVAGYDDNLFSDYLHVSTDERGWWFSRPDDYFNAHDPSNCIKGYEDSLQTITQAFIEQVRSDLHSNI